MLTRKHLAYLLKACLKDISRLKVLVVKILRIKNKNIISSALYSCHKLHTYISVTFACIKWDPNLRHCTTNNKHLFKRNDLF